MTPQEFLKEYSSEPQLIPLEHLAVHELNRGWNPLNGEHVMSLMTKFWKGSKRGGEDFQTYRYKPGRGVEPDPKDMDAAARHTNKMSLNDPRIRPVSGHGHVALFSKSHCWCAVWSLAGKSVRSSSKPEAEVMVPPEDQKDLQAAIQKGMWVEVVRFEGVRDHPDVFAELIRSENIDHSEGLEEDEVTFIVLLHQKMATLKASRGERHFDSVLRDIQKTPGISYGPECIEARYNLVKLIGSPQLEFLTHYCAVFVDFKKISVGSQCLQALCKLHPKCPWLKICLLCDLYNTVSPQTKTANKGIADNWNKATITDIVKAVDAEAMQGMEDVVAKFLPLYKDVPGVSSELLHKLRCRFVVKVGMLLRTSRLRADWCASLAKIEHDMRKKLIVDDLPLPLMEAPQEEEVSKKAACSQKPCADEMPALTFDSSGNVKEDVTCLARVRGLVVGSTVVTLRAARGIKRGCVGKIVGFGKKDPRIQFDDEADGIQEIEFPIASVEKREPQQKRSKVMPKASETVAVPDGTSWKHYGHATMHELLVSDLLSFMTRLSIAHGPAHDEIAILEEPRRVVCKVEFEPLALKLIPRASALEQVQKARKGIPEFDVEVTMPGVADPVYFRRLSPLASDGQLDGPDLVVDVARLVCNTTLAGGDGLCGCIELRKQVTAAFEIPTGISFTTMDKNFKVRKATGRWSVRITYWTNDVKAPQGATLIALA